MDPDPHSYYGSVCTQELIKQFLLPNLGQVAREILLNKVTDGRRKFIKNLLVDFLCAANQQTSQPLRSMSRRMWSEIWQMRRRLSSSLKL
jgi:hypothetical protein